MLIYIKGERRVGKNRIVKPIEMRFILLGKRKKLLISAPTDSTANKISGNTVHTALEVSNRARKNYKVKTRVQ